MTRTALIAGQGALPGLLLRAMTAAGDPPLVAGMAGSEPDIAGASVFRLERLAVFLDGLVDAGVSRAVFAGSVRRPPLDPEAFDPRTAQLVPALLRELSRGDDAALRAILGLFEDWGISVVGADVVAPDLVPSAGLLAGAPTPADEADAARAAAIVEGLGALDIGQGAVVAQGLCLAVEALPGTDAMLDFVVLHGGLRPDPAGARGVLYKAPKPGQDLRVDLPTLGRGTVERAARAGLAGIAWAAGSALLIDREATIAAAREAGALSLVAAMRIFLIAGEPSGDALGAALMRGLKSLAPGIAFDGVGGPLMQAEGLTSRFPMQELSVMGLMEVLPKYRALKARVNEMAAAVTETRPDALVTIDSPDFCLRVARLARAARADLRTIHYVAPTVWAWRPGRAAKMAPFIDHVLALFPFEPPYMQAAGMSCDFVGHPVVAEAPAGPDAAQAFRDRHGIDPDQPLALCLPGSRRGEVARLGPRFDEALMRLRDREPRLRVVLPTVSGVAGMVREMAARWPVPPLVVETPADRRAAFAAADLALAASGTVSLELAANRLPMVIAYDFNRISWLILRRMALTDTVTLVNLVSETRDIPEFLGPACRPGPISRCLAMLLDDDEARERQIAAMDLCMARLGRGGEDPGLRAARSVLARL